VIARDGGECTGGGGIADTDESLRGPKRLFDMPTSSSLPTHYLATCARQSKRSTAAADLRSSLAYDRLDRATEGWSGRSMAGGASCWTLIQWGAAYLPGLVQGNGGGGHRVDLRGIDWPEKLHDVCVMGEDGRVLGRLRVDHSVRASPGCTS